MICPECGSDLTMQARDGNYCRHCGHVWLNGPCALELHLRANAMQRHIVSIRGEAEAREEPATPMTEGRHA